jgi:hypothetical protein
MTTQRHAHRIECWEKITSKYEEERYTAALFGVWDDDDQIALVMNS